MNTSQDIPPSSGAVGRALGTLPWGSHVCLFYQGKDELLEVLVPYFAAGLAGQELCVWIASPVLDPREAWDALSQQVPDLDAHRRSRRIEIIAHEEWFLTARRPDRDWVVANYTRMCQEALGRGCTGMRFSNDPSWLDEPRRRACSEYAAELDEGVRRSHMRALCTYALERCDTPEVIRVVGRHRRALIKRDGGWEGIEAFDPTGRRERSGDAPAVARRGAGASLGDLIDLPAMQALMESYCLVARTPAGVIDTEGRVIVSAGWQDVCTKFHRAHPAACRRCVESDTRLTAGIAPGEVRLYRCANNMWDAATPIMLGDERVGHIFVGQFFFDDEALDRDLFRAQAASYGFPEEDYLAALDRVPRLSRGAVDAALEFFLHLAQVLSKLGHALHERELMARSLREVDRRRTEFIATLSHELRNPLAPIRNCVSILKRAAPRGEKASFAISVIDRQVAQLAHLVDGLLDVSRLVRNNLQLYREPVELNQLVARELEGYEALFESNGVTLERSLGAEQVFIDADPARVAQIVGNLLENAARFTGRGGRARVEVGVERGPQQAVLRVVDTGVGMSSEVLAHVFEPFAQGAQSLARSKGGLGIGLSLVKELVELHGGEVTAHSDGPGMGSELTVRLPLVQAPSGQARAATRARSAGAPSVLVIEDNVDAAESLQEALLLCGCVVELAFDGLEGLSKARSMRPDVVVCDIGLPGMDGYEVARALRADDATRGVRLVALTGYTQPEDVARAGEAGFDRHVSKPPDIEQLAAALAEP